MGIRRGRVAPRRRRPGVSYPGRRRLAALAAAASLALLTGCPGIPPPEALAFETDPRILRGAFLGTVDTRAAPFSMALAGDASLLVASWSDSVEFWDPEASRRVATVPTPSEWGTAASSLSVDRAGSLVAGVLSGNVHLWDGQDGSLVRAFDPGDRFGSCVSCGANVAALNPSGDLVAVGGRAPHVLVVDTATGAVVRELATAGAWAGLVAFGADGALLASATFVSDDRYALRVWETDTYGVVFEREATVAPGHLAQFAFSADGRRFAVGSATKLEVHDLAGGAIVIQADETTSMRFVSASPDGTRATLLHTDELGVDHAIVDLATGTTVARIADAYVGASAWSADGRYLLAGAKLVRTADWGVVHDYVTGQLYGLELDATAEYVDAYAYAVAGTLRIDGGEGIEFRGSVAGNESQRYVLPQARAPEKPSLEIELFGHPWRLQAWQTSRTYDYGFEPDEWWGSVTDTTLDEDQPWTPLRLWRAP